MDNLYVLTLRTPNGSSLTSVHRTQKGAEKRLHKTVKDWGLEELYDNDELEYGISFLPVED